jgi:TonB family protein
MLCLARARVTEPLLPALILAACLAPSPAGAQAAAPPFAAAPDAVRVGGGVQVPARTKYVAPEYSEAQRQAGVRGTVNVEVLIAPSGKVQDARVVKSVPQLDRSALDAVRQWEFEPTLVNGAAVPLVITLNVAFPPKPAPGARSGAPSPAPAPGGGDAGAGQTAPGTGRNAADERSIMQMRSRHDAAVAARAVDGILGFYVDDALVMPPGRGTLVGKAAIRSWIAAGGTMPSPGNIALDIEVIGEVAFYRADPSGRGVPAAAAAEDQTRVVWLLAKQEDGSWRIAASIWNTVK